MMDTVALLPEEHPEGMAEEKQDSSEKEDEDGEEEMDEHVWTSPANSIKITKAIEEKLCSIDRENATSYQKMQTFMYLNSPPWIMISEILFLPVKGKKSSSVTVSHSCIL